MSDDKTCVNIRGVGSLDLTIENLLLKLIEINKNLLNEIIKIQTTLNNTKSTFRQRHYDEVRTSVSTEYTNENIYDFLSQNAENITVINDGPGIIYIKYSNNGINYSNEFIIHEGEAKKYINVHTLKVRTSTIGITYRITEFEIWKQKNIEYFSGNPYVSETTVDDTGLANANIEDIKDGISTINGASRDDTSQMLKRNAHSGELANLGLGTLYVAFNNGNEYSNERTIPPFNSHDLGGMDIAKLRIRTDIINTEYRLAAQ